MGDAHRHTDIRGHSGVDGSVLDTYRYALDAAQLDWLGTSDHNEVTGGRWPDGLRDYQWWTAQKTVDLMSHPPVFIGVYSYEHSLARPSGRRNVLFLKRGGPLRVADRERRREDNLPPNLWQWMTRYAPAQPGQKVVLVPHTFGERSQPMADFNWQNARFDCLLEIYQGARSSYEAWRLPAGERRGSSQVGERGHFAQDALGNGNIYGFVSFSDHGSTHNSWAAVWAPAQDREGLFDGLYQRRTYAAGDEIIIRAAAGGHMPGEEFAASAGDAPSMEASIEAPDAILRIDVRRRGSRSALRLCRLLLLLKPFHALRGIYHNSRHQPLYCFRLFLGKFQGHPVVGHFRRWEGDLPIIYLASMYVLPIPYFAAARGPVQRPGGRGQRDAFDAAGDLLRRMVAAVH
jgi:hypothetical protein